MERRDFFKKLGVALGGVVLTSSTSCHSGSDDGTPVTPIPNAFGFHGILKTGDPLPGGKTLDGLPGVAMINNRDEIFFYGLDSDDVNGVYELTVDYAGQRPAVVSSRKVVAQGDTLLDGKQVDRMTTADVNDHGSFSAVLHTSDQLPSVYLEREKRGLEPVAGLMTPVAGVGKLGAAFGDVDLHDDDDILMVAHFGHQETSGGHQGLFHLPGGEVNAATTLVASTADVIPDGEGRLTGLGLVDMNDGGNYVVQAYGDTIDAALKRARSAATGKLAPTSASLLIRGNVSSAFTKKLLSAAPSISAKAGGARRQALSRGELRFGPRVGSHGEVAYVTHLTETQMELHVDDRVVLSTGMLSPLGDSIMSLCAPVVGSDGLVYSLVLTQKGTELVVANQREVRTVLATGDVVDGAALKTILFGFSPEQVDDAGRLVLVGAFDDGSWSIVVGVPA